jgi:3-hydroxybutyryl-CoA dehydratase
VNWSASFDELETGLEFTSRGRTITEADVVNFSALTGDWHPQHADAQWAASSQFGERVAHGMLVISFAVGLVPLDPERVVALRRIADAVFKRPVKLGDTLTVQGTVEELTPMSDEVGLVTWAWKVVNQDGELACRARIEVLWRRDGAQESESQAADEDAAAPVPL